MVASLEIQACMMMIDEVMSCRYPDDEQQH
ncbi:hypothetical protein LINPERHAP2_LOCUS1181, partial [Linum perenne]